MKTLAVLSRKGGTGKTTLALHLAVAARNAGLSVLVVDLDRQQSSVDWRRQRGRCDLLVEAVKPGALFTRQQDARRDGVDLLIVDTGPSLESDVEQAIRCADLCGIVARPNFFDIKAVADTAALAHSFHRDVVFVINQAPSRRNGVENPAVGEAVLALRSLGGAVAPIGLRSRVAYQQSVALGLTAQEHDPESAAANEIAALWTWIEARLQAERAPAPQTPTFVSLGAERAARPY
jgi:chromosome partitioning protein